MAVKYNILRGSGLSQKGRTMGKYKYRGYTYFATNNWIYTNVQRFQFTRLELRPVYHIEGLKDAGTRPFLTSVRQCKDYIDLAISRMQKEGGEQQ